MDGEFSTDTLYHSAMKAACAAGKVILEVYSKSIEVELKRDNSPLTEADRLSHKVIVDGLKDYGLPVLSEEGRSIPFEERAGWSRFWMVDPLDGTKEFIRRNGEFTVNIALIRSHEPEFGVIYVPVNGNLYFGGLEMGSYLLAGFPELPPTLEECVSQAEKLPVPGATERPFTVIGSRSHMNAETEEYFSKIRREKKDIEFFSIGSSLKLCMIAEGRADEYPRFAPTMEWDTAAGQAIVEGAGREVLHYKSGKKMMYNKENLLNDWFIAKTE